MIDWKEQKIVQKKFNSAIIEQFRNDSEFIYKLPPSSRFGLLKMLFQKFFEWLVAIFGNEFISGLILIVLIILGLVGFGFALYGLFGIGKTLPVYAKDKNGLDYSVKDENIHEIDFTEEIDIAISQKDFKRAVRLVYLFALKILTDQSIIEWSPSKTNHDYIYEIDTDVYRDQFTTLSYYFDHVWYGDFHAGSEQYEAINNTFLELRRSLQQNA